MDIFCTRMSTLRNVIHNTSGKKIEESNNFNGVADTQDISENNYTNH